MERPADQKGTVVHFHRQPTTLLRGLKGSYFMRFRLPLSYLFVLNNRRRLWTESFEKSKIIRIVLYAVFHFPN